MKYRFYIAGRLGMEDEVRRLKKTVEELGHTIIYDWTETYVPKPFEENIEKATQAAEAMAQAVMACDIFVLLCAKGGLGMHIETGGALIASIITTFIMGGQPKKIYIVGDRNIRSSIFYFHKAVTRVPDVDTLVNIVRTLP